MHSSHVENGISMHKLMQITAETLEEVKNLTLNMRAVMSDVIDTKALENGQVTASEVKNILSDFKGSMLKEVADLLQEMRGFMANSAEEKSVLTSSTNSTNAHALFACAEADSNAQKYIKFTSVLSFLKLIESKAGNFGC